MESRPRPSPVLISFFALLAAAGACPTALFSQAAASSPHLTYTRTFKGSNPEYLAISLGHDGAGSYEGHRLDEASKPRPLQLSATTTARVFALVGRLHNFQSVELESHKKVANLGQKTFIYQQGEDVNRAAFNYTENPDARELVNMLEGVAAVEEHISALEFEMKYDPLRLAEELLQIQIDLNNKSLADPELLVPTLQRIAQGSRFLHLAQTRAKEIMERVQPAP
jgi:hypothetical protein